jgi:plasmid stabilization system protein ParE
MAEIVWTEFALDDLQSIYNFIAKDSKFYADRFIDKLIARVDIYQISQKQGVKYPNLRMT